MLARIIKFIRLLRYPGSGKYWEKRYAAGGRSGAGSLGAVAQFKADFLNAFVRRHGIRSVAELGCGDGDQLALAEYPVYRGLDIAPSAVQMCRERFAGDQSKRFEVYDPESFIPGQHTAELAISLEVIFHLTEENVYKAYMQHLYALGRRWVIVFASNQKDTTGGVFPHFRLREWVPDVPQGWILRERLACPYQKGIVSDFWVFERDKNA